MKVVATEKAPKALGPYSTGIHLQRRVLRGGTDRHQPGHRRRGGGYHRGTDRAGVQEHRRAPGGRRHQRTTKSSRRPASWRTWETSARLTRCMRSTSHPSQRSSCVAVKTLPKNVLCESRSHRGRGRVRTKALDGRRVGKEVQVNNGRAAKRLLPPPTARAAPMRTACGSKPQDLREPANPYSLMSLQGHRRGQRERRRRASPW